jgi:hypothetical protein
MKAFHFKANKVCWRNIRLLCLLALAVSTTSIGVIAGYVLQSESIPLEIKEPIEILGCPSGFSLFPGETEEFSVTVQNAASINYSVALECCLNDTEYQAKYVIFSNETYTINSGKQILAAWLTVSSDATPGNFLVTISLTRRNLAPEAQPTPTSSPSPLPELSLSPSLLLLGSGAKWAANDSGGSALFINWKDNWAAHHLTDGADWGPWCSEEASDNSRLLISQTLQQAGFEVNFASDIPQNLSGYNLVFVEAYYAAEPEHNALLRDYLANGGGVVIVGGVPCYFSVYCKDMWPYLLGGMDLTSLQDWFGCRYYVNTGGTARAAVNNPFSTTILTSDTLVTVQGYSAAAVSTPSNSTQVIALWDQVEFWDQVDLLDQGALWDQRAIFAFTHEYGQGRVYYQASY